MDGLIIINKEKGFTSNDVVQIIKKKFNEKEGHTGTLDPMATGVLPILVGKGTLLSKYLINHDKIYTATVKLGIKTDTGDITGNIIEKKDVPNDCFKEDKLIEILKKMNGVQQQIPPMYSAIKVNGRKLYEYARNGQRIDVTPRIINIYATELIELSEKNNEITFRVSCSKGTYIRTLCETLAEMLGTVGTMCELNREKVGEFRIEQSVKINDLKKEDIIPIERFMINNSEIILLQKELIAFINGVKLVYNKNDGIYRIYDLNKKFIGIGKINQGFLKRDIVI